MKQTRLESLTESCINVASGFVISVLAGVLIYPLFGVRFSLTQLSGITAVFTIISVLRGYFWRRFFNAQVHKTVHSWFRKGR